MLQANKASVLTGFHMGSMRVQYLEIEYLMMVFNKITSLASLLFGFAASALMLSTSLGEGGSYLKLLHVLFTTSALGFMLLVLLIATLCTMWGPGRALCSASATSMQEAVFRLNSAVIHALCLFSVGLGCYLFSSILSMMLFQPLHCAVVSVTIISVGGLMLLRAGMQVVHALWTETAIPAAIRGDPLMRARSPTDAVEAPLSPQYVPSSISNISVDMLQTRCDQALQSCCGSVEVSVAESLQNSSTPAVTQSDFHVEETSAVDVAIGNLCTPYGEIEAPTLTFPFPFTALFRIMCSLFDNVIMQRPRDESFENRQQRKSAVASTECLKRSLSPTDNDSAAQQNKADAAPPAVTAAVFHESENHKREKFDCYSRKEKTSPKSRTEQCADASSVAKADVTAEADSSNITDDSALAATTSLLDQRVVHANFLRDLPDKSCFRKYTGKESKLSTNITSDVKKKTQKMLPGNFNDDTYSNWPFKYYDEGKNFDDQVDLLEQQRTCENKFQEGEKKNPLLKTWTEHTAQVEGYQSLVYSTTGLHQKPPKKMYSSAGLKPTATDQQQLTQLDGREQQQHAYIESALSNDVETMRKENKSYKKQRKQQQKQQHIHQLSHKQENPPQTPQHRLQEKQQFHQRQNDVSLGFANQKELLIWPMTEGRIASSDHDSCKLCVALTVSSSDTANASIRSSEVLSSNDGDTTSNGDISQIYSRNDSGSSEIISNKEGGSYSAHSRSISSECEADGCHGKRVLGENQKLTFGESFEEHFFAHASPGLEKMQPPLVETAFHVAGGKSDMYAKRRNPSYSSDGSVELGRQNSEDFEEEYKVHLVPGSP